jgi:cell division protein FtsB
MNTWVAVYRAAWIALLALVAIGLVCVFLPKLRGVRALQNRKAALDAGNLETATRIVDMKRNQERFRSDPGFVELTARRMGMAKEGETVIRCTNSLLDSAAEALP